MTTAAAVAPTAMVRRLGVVGGGQLAAMLTDVAVAHGFEVTVLEPAAGCPAAQSGARQIVASLFDETALTELVAGVDVTTVDLEHVHVEALARLAAAGHRVVPAPEVLGVIANKLEQKRMYVTHGIPTSRFEALAEPSPEAARAFGLPAVHKAERGGYDGRGVAVLRAESDLANMLPGPGFLEAYVEHTVELGVIVVRAGDGATCTYPVTEMRFDQSGNLLDYLVAPARIPVDVQRNATRLALAAVRAVDGIGVFGVEMFLASDGSLLVNEMAPRTHNCGHFSIDACVSSQFEQQLRILAGLPLGDPGQLRPAAMVNLLGAPGYTGETVVEGTGAFAGMADVHVHLYGKQQCRALRKMGHLTALGASVEEALARALDARERIIIRGKDAA